MSASSRTATAWLLMGIHKRKLRAQREVAAARPHRWIMVSVFEVTEPEAQQIATNGENVLLGGHNVLTVEGPGCLDCEQHWTEGHDEPCTAERFDIEVDPRLRLRFTNPS